MATKTKTEKNLTPKQAQVKVTTLLKGIDNNSLVIAKRQEQNNEAVKQIQTLLPMAVTQPVTTVAKETKSEKAIKSKKVAAAKAVKSVVKPAAKPDNRPPLKDVITEIIQSVAVPPKAAEIYRTACDGYGKWSRQSVYNALDKHFDKNSDGGHTVRVKNTPSGMASTGEQDDADRFVESVQATDSTATVV